MKNETGNKYGRLVVLARAEENEKTNRCIKWMCRCTCGTITPINGNNLRFGRTRSCGKCYKTTER